MFGFFKKKRIPLLQAVSNGDVQLVREAIGRGEDPNEISLEVSQWPFELKKYPGYVLLPVTMPATAWSLGHREVFEELRNTVLPETADVTLWLALMCGLDDLAGQFDPGSLAGKKEPIEGVPAFLAAMFGACSLEVFKKVWDVTPDNVRHGIYTVSTAPPGHEEGNFDYPSGDVAFWANYLGREDYLT